MTSYRHLIDILLHTTALKNCKFVRLQDSVRFHNIFLTFAPLTGPALETLGASSAPKPLASLLCNPMPIPSYGPDSPTCKIPMTRPEWHTIISGTAYLD